MIRLLAASGQETIELSDSAIKHMGRHRQRKPGQREAGGQLFARMAPGVIRIEKATGPTCFDVRGRFLFVPSNGQAARTIRAMHKRGLHYVGDWHTHPESVPTPSAHDVGAICSAYRESVHNLAGFLMIIVGTSPLPDGLFVAIADIAGVHPLVPATDEDPDRPPGWHNRQNAPFAINDAVRR